MKIQKAELLAALDKVKPGLATIDRIEQATHFAFMGDRVVTYNDEISVSCKVAGMDLTGAVDAKHLYAFLNKVKKPELITETTDNEIRLKVGKGTAGLAFMDEVTLPLHELGEIDKWSALPNGFMDALLFCRFSCFKNMSRPILTCVHVGSDFVESCDNTRLTYLLLNEKNPVPDFLIPGSTVSLLAKYDVSKIATSEGWVHFQTADGGLTFSCRVFEDNYPDTTAIREEVEGATEVILPKDLPTVLGKVEVFAHNEEENKDRTEIKLSKKKFTVRSQNQVGWYEETLPVRYTGEELRFKTNPAFLVDMLSKTDRCAIGEKKIRFGAVEEDGWTHIIALPFG